MSLINKTIWITGASSGIGEALAYELAVKDNILILSGRDEQRLKKVKQICKNEGSQAYVVPFDLSSPKEVEETARKVLDHYPKIDVLINNGGLGQRSLITETSTQIDRQIMEINYFSNVILTKTVLPSMIEKGGGQIAVTSSIVGKFGFPMRSSYSASKHALYGFYETLRMEMRKHNVSVNIICPGRIRTNISYHAVTKEGKEHGKMDQGQETGMPAGKCAKKIVKGMERNKKEILVGRKELIMVYLKRFFPVLFYKVARTVKHF
ncbi:MAG: SDR family oxidoreductase [Bacteroidales bacterium]